MLAEDLPLSGGDGIGCFLDADCEQFIVVVSDLLGLDHLNVLSDEVIFLAKSENLAERHVTLGDDAKALLLS